MGMGIAKERMEVEEERIRVLRAIAFDSVLT